MKKIIVLVLLVFFSHSAMAGFSWPTFHYAPDMEINWTADRMIYNGMPMKVENFKCECTVEDLLAYYQGRWEKEKKKVMQQNLGDFEQIGFADRKYFYAVVVKPDSLDVNYSVGRITISELPDNKQKRYVLGEGIPKYGDSQVVNDVHDAMPGKRSRTVLMTNYKSVEENATFYRNYYRNKGWKSYLRPINREIGAQALSYSFKNKDANIVIHRRNGQSSILFNEVTEVR